MFAVGRTHQVYTFLCCPPPPPPPQSSSHRHEFEERRHADPCHPIERLPFLGNHRTKRPFPVCAGTVQNKGVNDPSNSLFNGRTLVSTTWFLFLSRRVPDCRQYEGLCLLALFPRNGSNFGPERESPVVRKFYRVSPPRDLISSTSWLKNCVN